MEGVGFLGYTPQAEVRKVIPLLRKMEKDVERLSPLIELAVSYGLNPEAEAFSASAFDGKAKDLKMRKATVSVLFTGLYLIFKAAVRTKVSVPKFERDLLALGIPGGIVTVCKDKLKSSFKALQTRALEHRLSFPGLRETRWRVDVIISTGSLNRVLAPVVFMELLLTDGTVCQMEVSPLQFQKLRYHVASVLQDFHRVEGLGILKIDK